MAMSDNYENKRTFVAICLLRLPSDFRLDRMWLLVEEAKEGEDRAAIDNCTTMWALMPGEARERIKLLLPTVHCKCSVCRQSCGSCYHR
jgi:hypothetical protein